MSLAVFSDLHIHGPEDPMYAKFLAKLKHHQTQGDQIFLLGDIFDLFVGDQPHFYLLYKGFFEAVSQGPTPVHFVEGNHDFNLQPKAGLVVHRESTQIHLEGSRIFLAHGDLIDQSDRSYLLLRKALRSTPVRSLSRILPGTWVDRIGQSMSQASREYHREPDERIRTLFRNHALRHLEKNFDCVILGHCHDLDQWEFEHDGHPKQYINMGYPKTHGSYLTFDPISKKMIRTPI